MNDDPSLWRTVFGDQSLILALFGGLGGSVRSLALRTTWAEGVRVTLIGGMTSFGIGVLAPAVLKPYFGPLESAGPGALGALTAAAFLLGLLSVTVIERIIDRATEQKEDDE